MSFPTEREIVALAWSLAALADGTARTIEAPARTALHERHVALGALHDFGGWEMPVRYGSIIDEHLAVRSASASSTSRIWASCAWTARTPPPRLPPRSRTTRPLAVGRAQYSLICAPDGGVIDDLIVYRTGERYLVVPNAGNAAVAAELGSASPASTRDSTMRRRDLARGGPGTARRRRARAARGRARSTLCVPIRPPRGRVAGIAALVARTGYTGEDGFELFVTGEHGRGLWRALGAGARGRVATRRAGCPRHPASRSRHAALWQRARPHPARSRRGSGASCSSTASRGFVGRDALAAAVRPVRASDSSDSSCAAGHRPPWPRVSVTPGGGASRSGRSRAAATRRRSARHRDGLCAARLAGAGTMLEVGIRDRERPRSWTCRSIGDPAPAVTTPSAAPDA